MCTQGPTGLFRRLQTFPLDVFGAPHKEMQRAQREEENAALRTHQLQRSSSTVVTLLLLTSALQSAVSSPTSRPSCLPASVPLSEVDATESQQCDCHSSLSRPVHHHGENDNDDGALRKVPSHLCTSDISRSNLSFFRFFFLRLCLSFVSFIRVEQWDREGRSRAANAEREKQQQQQRDSGLKLKVQATLDDLDEKAEVLLADDHDHDNVDCIFLASFLVHPGIGIILCLFISFLIVCDKSTRHLVVPFKVSCLSLSIRL